MQQEFKEFPKLSRLSREIIITEKIDGTNASISLTNNFADEFPNDSNIIATVNGFNIRTGSRTRWITPKDDNFGFSNWVFQNAEEITGLGEGVHFGEWWGSGIQRSYGLQKGDKRFSLFNTNRWRIENFDEKGFEIPPKCCSIVPELARGIFNSELIENTLLDLISNGSYAAQGFMKPEGIVIFHTAANMAFKKTIEKDETPKSLIK